MLSRSRRWPEDDQDELQDELMELALEVTADRHGVFMRRWGNTA
jgi:hypothetical protein